MTLSGRVLGPLAALALASSASAAPGVPVPGAPSVAPEVAPAVPGAGPRAPGRSGQWVPGEVVVQRRPALSATGLSRLHARVGAAVVERVPAFDVEVVRLDPGVRVLEAVAAYESAPGVVSAEPNLRRLTLEIPNDPRFPQQWGLRNKGRAHEIADPPPPSASGKGDSDIDANEAWDRELGTQGTVVAVLDSGADLAHPDLDGNLWRNPQEFGGTPGDDDDGNGLVDDINGYDFQDDDADPDDSDPNERGHGTHIAGTIAAEGNNSQGIAGVCRGCRVMVLRFGLTLSEELEALAYARTEGADIINASYGGPSFSLIERKAFSKTGRAGVLSVMAAGNANLDNDLFLARDNVGRSDDFSPLYPASYTLPSILSVAASNHSDRYGYRTGCARGGASRAQCAFTSWGHNSVDLAAPGVDVFSTTTVAEDPRRYTVLNGTSFAAPHVAGVAGLVKSAHPGYSAVEVKNAILRSVDTPKSLKVLHAFPGGSDSGAFTRTSGRLNAARALGARPKPFGRPNDGAIGGAKRIKKAGSGRVRWPADSNDVYKKKLRRSLGYKVVLDGPRQANLDLIIYKPKTKEIWQIDPRCFGVSLRVPCENLLRYEASRGGRERTTIRAKGRGVYYFHVSGGLRTRAAYTLKVKRARG